MEIREKSGECPLILQMRGAYRFLNFGSYEICLLCLITTGLLKKKYEDVHGIIMTLCVLNLNGHFNDKIKPVTNIEFFFLVW